MSRAEGATLQVVQQEQQEEALKGALLRPPPQSSGQFPEFSADTVLLTFLPTRGHSALRGRAGWASAYLFPSALLNQEALAGAEEYLIFL